MIDATDSERIHFVDMELMQPPAYLKHHRETNSFPIALPNVQFQPAWPHLAIRGDRTAVSAFGRWPLNFSIRTANKQCNVAWRIHSGVAMSLSLRHKNGKRQPMGVEVLRRTCSAIGQLRFLASASCICSQHDASFRSNTIEAF